MNAPTESDLWLLATQTNVLEVHLDDLDGHSIDIQADEVRLDFFDPDLSSPPGAVALSKVSSAGGHADGANGVVRFTVQPNEWPALVNGQLRLYYEVRRVQPDATETVHICGSLLLVSRC